MRPLVALALLAAVAPAAPVPKAVKKQEVATHVGVWKPDDGKGSEWFEFTADGQMRAWTSSSRNTPASYTYTVDADPDGRPWRMIWSPAGSPKPSHQAVFVIDGDRMFMTYSGYSDRPSPKPDAKAAPTFTRETADK